MRFSPFAKQTALTILTLTVMVVSAMAVAPTRDAVKKWKAEGVWEQKVANWKAFKKAGGSAPEVHSPFDKEKHRQNLALGIKTVDTVNVIVILVDFEDWPYDSQAVAGTPANFDSILFSNRDTDPIFNPTGSMTDYYLENSYGRFYIKGDIFGWYRMDSTYEWYVGSDDGLTNGCILAGHAVDSAAADTNVDFSDYDRDQDGSCDGVIIIHPGRGAEERTYGIWSHKWNICPARYYDGVTISAYTMNPEETWFPTGVKLSPIGVFCHEYGHILGLPDLYDVDYNPGSSGLGQWSLMAYGNQLNNSKTPAHLDAWCKASVGFLDFIEVEANVFQDTIPAIEYNPVAYKLKNSYTGSHEYWVVENRQRTGFDLYLPGQGLCIYHVDTLAPINNTNPDRYYVAMEQADGKNDLALTDGNKGDAGDPWPGLAREFHNLSTPNSRTNVGGFVTQIGVWRISDSDSLMTADFDIEYSRPWVELYGSDSLVFIDDSPGGDGDGILEAGETIQFYCTIINEMRNSYNIHATLATDNPAVDFVTANVAFGADLFDSPRDNAGAPIEFTLTDTLMPIIDSFFLTITTDSLVTTPGSGEFTRTFGFEVQVGAPQVLLVDDDRGEDFETKFEEAFLRLRVPTETWHKQTQDSPTGADLAKYSVVFWHTGYADSGVLDSNDIAAMKYFMDNGGNLLLTTLSGTYDLVSLDSTFLPEYFHADTVGNISWSRYGGVPGNEFSEGTVFRYDTQYGKPYVPLLTAVGGGEIAFTFAERYQDSVCGVSYVSTHKSILLTFPVEFLRDNATGYDPKDTLIARSLAFFGGIVTSVYDGRPFAQLPQNFELYQNYPNPFNPATNISYTLRSTGGIGGAPARTNLAVYNVLGQRVKTLVDEVQIPGTHVVSWNGTDRFGRRVASGVYFYRLKRGDDSETKKMVLLK